MLAGAVVYAGVYAGAEHLAQSLCCKWGKWLEGNCKICTDLQTDIQYCGTSCHIALGNLPRLCIRNVLVAKSGYSHSILKSLAEMVALKIPLQRLLYYRKFCHNCLIYLLQLAGLRHLTLEIFVRKHNSPIYKIPEYCHQLTIVPGLEISPAEVIILSLRSICGKHIPHHILLARELLQILMRPDCPVSGGGDFAALQVKELIGRNIIGKNIAISVRLKHRREDYAVEDNIILAYEVHKPGIRALPPLLPALREQLLCIGDVANRRIKPDIEHLALCTLYRHRHAPVEVSANGTRLQPAIYPALALPVNIAAPLLVSIQNPLGEPLLVLVKRQVPVGSLLLYRLHAAKLALWVYKLLRRERAAALLALVAISALCAALRAGAHYVSVCKEGLLLRVVVLLTLLCYEFTLVVEPSEELRGILMVYCR